MRPLENVNPQMSAEKSITVTHEMTVAHFLKTMPAVYATPIMILHMEMVSGDVITPHLPEGYVSVGMEVNVRHLAATAVGRVVRVTSKVLGLKMSSVLFEVAAWDGERRIGEGTHRRGVVNVAEFEKRFGVS